MNILHVKSITLTHILCVRCSFWRFLPLQICFTITVISFLKYSYFEIFIVVNQPYFVPHTIPYNMLKFSTVLLVT